MYVAEDVAVRHTAGVTTKSTAEDVATKSYSRGCFVNRPTAGNVAGGCHRCTTEALAAKRTATKGTADVPPPGE